MYGDGPLTFQEFAMREPHPLAVMTAWKNVVAQEILPEDEDAGY